MKLLSTNCKATVKNVISTRDTHRIPSSHNQVSTILRPNEPQRETSIKLLKHREIVLPTNFTLFSLWRELIEETPTGSLGMSTPLPTPNQRTWMEAIRCNVVFKNLTNLLFVWKYSNDSIVEKNKTCVSFIFVPLYLTNAYFCSLHTKWG